MKMRVWVATVTALLAVTVGMCNFLKSPRLIQEANQSWLPLPFSSALAYLKTVMRHSYITVTGDNSEPSTEVGLTQLGASAAGYQPGPAQTLVFNSVYSRSTWASVCSKGPELSITQWANRTFSGSGIWAAMRCRAWCSVNLARPISRSSCCSARQVTTIRN